MKYAWIEQNKLLWPVSVQCRILSVSASGYRQHRARKKKILTRRHLSETGLLVEIRAVYAEARGAYGRPRVWRQLKAAECAWVSAGSSGRCAERASRTWQVAISRCYHRQQPCSADCSQLALA